MSQILSTVFALLIGISVHECSHALVAYLLGDPTAKKQGRVTLNPFKHLDPLGSLMILYAGLSGFGFGWGKPVPVNPYNFKRRELYELLTALAGPASNFLIALLLGLFFRFQAVDPQTFFGQFLIATIMLNIGLMVFNLIPIPPLDGSAILGALFPKTWRSYQKQFQMYGGILLLLIIFLGRGMLSRVLEPVFMFFLKIVVGA